MKSVGSAAWFCLLALASAQQFPQQRPGQLPNQQFPGPQSQAQQFPPQQQQPLNTANNGQNAQSAQSNCPQRVAWSTMTAAAKNQFVEALLNLKRNGRYDQITQKHLDEASFTHGVSMFLPYHRYLVHDLEQALGMAVPYWDWSADSQAPHLSDIFSDDYFGGSGGAGNCVQNGKFTVDNGWEITVGTTGCLQRCFDGGEIIQPFSPPEFSAAFTSSSQTYEQFRNSIEGSIHAQVHNALGKRCSGDMAQLYSPNDPIFWLHHSNVDRLYYRWQMSCPAYGSTMPGQTHSYPTDLTAPIHGTQFTLADAMPGGRLCHNYARAPSDVALQVDCPVPPTNATDTPTATASGTTPTDSVTNMNNVDLTDAASGWLYNQVRFLVPERTSARTMRRLQRSFQIHSEEGGSGLQEIFSHNAQSFRRIWGSTESDVAPIQSGFNFQTEMEGGTRIVVGATPPTDDLTDKVHLRVPPPLDSDWIHRMKMNEAEVRRLESWERQIIEEINSQPGYVSPGSLAAQGQRQRAQVV